jgi:predicted dehydrogenase
MRTVKAAIIGTGFIGPAHVEAGRRIGGVEFAALAEAGRELAERKAAALGIPRACGDYRDVLADPEIEVVHNCTPNRMHFEINRAILQAGKHVISEKPLAMSSTETRVLVKEAKKAGVLAAVDFNYRSYPVVQEMRAMAADGRLGNLYLAQGSYLQDWLYLDTDYNWRLEPKLGGSPRAVGDVGSHWFDLFRHVTGEEIVAVSADFRTVHPTRRRPRKAVETYAGRNLRPADYERVKIETEDCATIQFRTDSGAVGSLVVSQVSAGRKNRLYIELSGSKSALWWDQERPNELTIGRREKANELLIKDPALLSPAAAAFAHYPGGHPEGYPDGLKNLCREFYARVRDPKLRREPAAFATFADGHRELVICEAVLASARKRAWVKVKA